MFFASTFKVLPDESRVRQTLRIGREDRQVVVPTVRQLAALHPAQLIGKLRNCFLYSSNLAIHAARASPPRLPTPFLN